MLLKPNLGVGFSSHRTLKVLLACKKTTSPFYEELTWRTFHVLIYWYVTDPLHYIGQRDFISYLDLQQINLMYNCLGGKSKFSITQLPFPSLVNNLKWLFFLWIPEILDVVDYADRICENQSRRITCYGGRKIKITYVNYGRRYSFKCGFGFNTNCVSSSSFEKVSISSTVSFSVFSLMKILLLHPFKKINC